jgi:hypothetical protein
MPEPTPAPSLAPYQQLYVARFDNLEVIVVIWMVLVLLLLGILAVRSFR